MKIIQSFKKGNPTIPDNIDEQLRISSVLWNVLKDSYKLCWKGVLIQSFRILQRSIF